MTNNTIYYKRIIKQLENIWMHYQRANKLWVHSYRSCLILPHILIGFTFFFFFQINALKQIDFVITLPLELLSNTEDELLISWLSDFTLLFFTIKFNNKK